VIVLSSILALGFWLGGQTTSTPPPEPEQVDVVDLWRTLRHKKTTSREPTGRMVTIAPVISAKPSTGFVIGVGGNLAGYRGDPATTRISSAVGALTFSTKKQVSLTVRFGMFTNEDRWRIEGDNRALWTSQDTFGLGIGTTEADRVNARFNHFRVEESILREVSPSLYLGGGLSFNAHTTIRPGLDADAVWDQSPYVTYSQQHGFDIGGQTSAGLIASVALDTRDSAINASRGWLARASFRTSFEGFVGADSTWTAAETDVRTYVKLSKRGRMKVAGWLFGAFVTSGVPPYFDLPATASDTYGRSGRGYPEGRFRGEELVTGEVEFRATLMRNGLLGAVAFINTTSVSDKQTSAALFDGFAGGAGFGLRVLFNKHSKTNLCIDVGFGRNGSHGIYLALQEAF
jgi:outer membrane protein assembly factor BamA